MAFLCDFLWLYFGSPLYPSWYQVTCFSIYKFMIFFVPPHPPPLQIGTRYGTFYSVTRFRSLATTVTFLRLRSCMTECLSVPFFSNLGRAVGTSVRQPERRFGRRVGLGRRSRSASDRVLVARLSGRWPSLFLLCASFRALSALTLSPNCLTSHPILVTLRSPDSFPVPPQPYFPLSQSYAHMHGREKTGSSKRGHVFTNPCTPIFLSPIYGYLDT